MGHLTKWDTFGRSGFFFYYFMVMKILLSGTLNKWDTSLSGTLFSVRKPKMNLTKWDTLLFESLWLMCYNISVVISADYPVLCVLQLG